MIVTALETLEIHIFNHKFLFLTLEHVDPGL